MHFVIWWCNSELHDINESLAQSCSIFHSIESSISSLQVCKIKNKVKIKFIIKRFYLVFSYFWLCCLRRRFRYSSYLFCKNNSYYVSINLSWNSLHLNCSWIICLSISLRVLTLIQCCSSDNNMSSSVEIVRFSSIFDLNVLQDLTFDQNEYDSEFDSFLEHHLTLLKSSENISYDTFNLEEICTTSLFSMSVKHQITKQVLDQIDFFSQYDLLVEWIDFFFEQISDSTTRNEESICWVMQDSCIFLNVETSWSVFICEFQESDKSHSLSCMLKNCLISNVCTT